MRKARGRAEGRAERVTKLRLQPSIAEKTPSPTHDKDGQLSVRGGSDDAHTPSPASPSISITPISGSLLGAGLAVLAPAAIEARSICRIAGRLRTLKTAAVPRTAA